MMAPLEPYPERRAGGYTRVDGTVEFYVRVRAILDLLGPDRVVMDFGAGRGMDPTNTLAVHRELGDLRSKARSVIGMDIDRAVMSNPWLTEAHVIQPGQSLPVGDGSVDLVVADHVFEHIVDPLAVAAQLCRSLREGGWICARTTNRLGYIAAAARLVPNRQHAAVLRRLQPDREERDVFPTCYRLNTRHDIAQAFPPSQFEHVVYGWEPEAAYVRRSVALGALFQAAGRVTPDRFRPILLVFLRRRESTGAAERADG